MSSTLAAPAPAGSPPAADPAIEETGDAVEDYDETVPQDPQVRVAELRHLISLPSPLVTAEERSAATEEALALIKKNNMTSHYFLLYPNPADRDAALVSEMKAATAAALADLDKKEEEAKATAGDSEVNEIALLRAKITSYTAPKADALAAYEACLAKAVGGVARIDLVMTMLRVSISYGDDIPEAAALLDRCSLLVEKEGDWDRRNRLGAYKALVAIWQRRFADAAKILVDAVPTFTCTELFSFETLVLLVVVTAIVEVDRVTLKNKVIDAPDVIQTIGDIPGLRPFLHSLYECNYRGFFHGLIDLAALAKRSRYFAPHVEHLLREARLVAYKQFLRSYQSVTLQSMSALFGVSVTFVDSDLSSLVAAGRLTCKIDAVDGVVEMVHPDQKTAQFTQLIKDGDVVLNRVQKLAQKLKST